MTVKDEYKQAYRAPEPAANDISGGEFRKPNPSGLLVLIWLSVSEIP